MAERKAELKKTMLSSRSKLELLNLTVCEYMRSLTMYSTAFFRAGSRAVIDLIRDEDTKSVPRTRRKTMATKNGCFSMSAVPLGGCIHALLQE